MDEQERYARARRKVDDIRGFYTHLAIFIIVNVFLFILNMVISPGAFWFYWVTIFWGVGLAVHALDTYGSGRFFGRDWEERKIREIMEREERR
ncbi:MAG: hypothetical protein PWR25_521 [Euryarchaeota archaeon]|jgi:hypothetical protein|nr:hypothetical protein [Euryarchaeota archaeon]